jgi:hypothetical protein
MAIYNLYRNLKRFKELMYNFFSEDINYEMDK